MFKIGSYTLVYNQTFLLPDNEFAYFEIPIMGSVLKLKIEFSIEESSPEVTWHTENDGVNMKFKGWRNLLGTSLTKPEKFGDVNGRSMAFMASNNLIGTTNHVTLQILLGE